MIDNNVIDIKKAAQFYNKSEFSITKEMDLTRGDFDKRHVYLLKFEDGEELALKVCCNEFTSVERVTGWQKLCEKYLEMDIYCPRFLNSLNGNLAETMLIRDDEYIVFAEEMKKYKTMDEVEPQLNYEDFKEAICESVGIVAENSKDLLQWSSVYCLYDLFDSTSETDENFENGVNFRKKIKENFPEYSDYMDKIWNIFLQKRHEFEPVYRALPKAAFQADLNRSNIMLDHNLKFVGLLDFNLCGTESVLCYITIAEVCGYNLDIRDLEHLMDKDFLKRCDDYLYRNLGYIGRNYTFSDYEKKNFCLCYNTIRPFGGWHINGLLEHSIKESKTEYIKSILDWVHYQLTRDDITLDNII